MNEEFPCKHTFTYCPKSATHFLRRTYRRHHHGQTVIVLWLCDEHFASAPDELMIGEWREISREEAVIDMILHMVHDS
jgi:hypothetical protein